MTSIKRNPITGHTRTCFCRWCKASINKPIKTTRAEKVKVLIDACLKLVGEPDCLCYPVKDVYGLKDKDDITAPLWTESGLYGRVGKEAARTLLAWRDGVIRALESLDVDAPREGN